MRIGRQQRRTSSVFVSTIVLLTGLSAATHGSASTLEQVMKTRKQGNTASAQSQQKIDEISERTATLAQQYRKVLDETDALRVYNSQLEKLLNSQQEDLASLDKQIEQVSLVSRALSPLMLRMIESLGDFVELDTPFLLEERRNRVARLREMMDRADVSDSEKYRRVLEAYQIENEYGRTIEAYQGSLRDGDRERAVDFLRFGRVVLVYQTLDGEESGVWNRKKGGWETLGSEYRVSIAQGLRIARKQAAPDLLRLPVPAAQAAK